MNFTLLVIISYLIGSIPSAIIISHLFGLTDPRQFGSGNPGATNVLRSGNKKAAVLTLLFDAIKGYIPLLIASQLHFSATQIAIAGLFAIIGHIFSFFLKFKGGKGVATSIGVLVGIQPIMALAVVIIWLLIATITRYSSLAAIIAAIATPILSILLDQETNVTLTLSVIVIIICWRHKTNICQLINKTETKIGQK